MAVAMAWLQFVSLAKEPKIKILLGFGPNARHNSPRDGVAGEK